MSEAKPKTNRHPDEKKDIAIVAQAGLPTGMNLDDLAADAGAGSENVTAGDMAIPIISILQANSPQCKKSDPKYIPGAEEGMLYNNVTEAVEGEELTVIPCHYEKVFIEWKPKRGGFVAIHPATTPLRDQVKMVKNEEGKEIPTLPSGNNLIETDQHYVLVLRDNGGWEAAVIAMSSTGLKASRLWNTLVDRVLLKNAAGQPFKPARFYMKYKLSTKARVKDAYSWYTWAVEPAGVVDDRGLYGVAKALNQAVRDGGVRIKQEQTDDAGAPAGAAEDDIPLDL